jgi:hypothetical protein
MLNTKVVEIWHTTFKKLGYEETRYNNWFKETKELIIILRVLTLPDNPEFFVDVGLIIKKLYHHGALQRPVWRYSHLGSSLWYLIYIRNEGKRTERYLNKLFNFDSKVNTDEQIVSNISKLSMMYRSRVVPIFDKLDYWVSEEENFNKKEAWKPFYEYFEPTLNVDWRIGRGR